VTLTTFGGGTTDVDVIDEYFGGPHFFTHSLPNQAVTAGASVTVTVTASTNGLNQGVYDGALDIDEYFFLSPVPVYSQGVPVVLAVPPTGPVPPMDRTATACTPTQLVPVVTNLGRNFSVSAGWPTPISVQVVDDCAGLNSAGSVAINFSNGDPPLVLKQQGDKSWAGTWVGGNAGAKVVLTVAATSVNPPLAGTTLLLGTVLANPDPPVISKGGILNGASFALQGPLSPGSFVTLFGSNLATSTLSAPSVPLPTVLAGSSLKIAGVPVPIFFSSTGQVNAIIPYGIAVNTMQQVVASRGTSLAVPQSVAIAAAAPGIFMYGQNQGIIVNASNALANSTNPVHAGDAVVIYCTGLGEVNPPVPAGTQTPLTVLSNTVNPVSVTIGGVSAPVAFAGLTPGSTGLYQVNTTVPAGIAAGDGVPVVLTAARQSSAPVVISVR
jgi:uncharacterized protein (TIGR03437 family)